MIREKSLYRNNYIPKTELSGAIMQCEKYIYNMASDTKKAEIDLNNQFSSVLPKDYKLQIVNPKAMIIMGRSNTFAEPQKAEIIRRKYKNILDIITYDDLLYRLHRTREILKERAEKLKE